MSRFFGHATLKAAAVLTAVAVSGPVLATDVELLPNGLMTPTTKEQTKANQFKKAPPWRIGVSFGGVGNTWIVQMIQEMKYTASQNKNVGEFIFVEANWQAAKQVADVEDLLTKAARDYVIYARDPSHSDLHVGGNRVHYATSGEAVSVLDIEARQYRPSTLVDVYDTARVVDALPNIHQYGQMVVPTEIVDLVQADINVAYAILAATTKPMEHALTAAEALPPILELYGMVAGSVDKFRDRPFVSFGGCPIVSPLRFAADSLDVLMATAREGLICDIAVAPQAGATAPTYLAGALVQVVAETLACLCVVNMVRPGTPMSFAAWPFSVDLRTGAFSGGSAEVAVMMAAIAQIGRFYDVPTTVASSMTDAKMPDAQMGYEKGITALAAGLAGAAERLVRRQPVQQVRRRRLLQELVPGDAGGHRVDPHAVLDGLDGTAPGQRHHTGLRGGVVRL